VVNAKGFEYKMYRLLLCNAFGSIISTAQELAFTLFVVQQAKYHNVFPFSPFCLCRLADVRHLSRPYHFHFTTTTYLPPTKKLNLSFTGMELAAAL
jgi:hypothetical protein